MKWIEKVHSQKAGFTLLELIMVVAVIGVLATALSGTIVGQYQMWQLNINQAKVVEQSELFISYLEKTINYENDDTENELSLKLDENRDGEAEKTIIVKNDAGSIEGIAEKYSKLITDITFEEEKVGLIKLDITLKSGDFKREITKLFYIDNLDYVTYY